MKWWNLTITYTLHMTILKQYQFHTVQFFYNRIALIYYEIVLYSKTHTFSNLANYPNLKNIIVSQAHTHISSKE